MSDLFAGTSTIEQPRAEPPLRSQAQRERRAKRRRAQRRRRTLLTILLLLVIVGSAAFVVRDQILGLVDDFRPTAAQDYPGPGGDTVSVTIPSGATGADMGQELLDKGVVASVAAFTAAFESNPGAAGIQAGTHQMLKEMKASDAVQRLVANQSRDDTKLTIPEGYTVDQILERATNVTGFSEKEFKAAMKDTKTSGLPAAADGNYEGWLFPTTYVLSPDDTAVTIVQKMVQQTLFTLEDSGVAKADYETVLIKASLIEREAKHDEDRPKMAAAIDNRLEAGDTLGIDAAVAYGAGKPGTELTKSDLADTSNPYNLRKLPGLPPTPIASPGAKSIDAVEHPADDGTYYYFWCTVNLDTGETVFSSTLAGQAAAEAQLDAWVAENSK